MQPTTLDAYRLLHDGILAFQRAEQQGMRIDVEHCRRTKEQLSKKIQILEHKFKETKLYKEWCKSTTSDININSNAQLGRFLYTVKKIRPKKFTPTGAGSTDEEALAQLKLPEIRYLQQIRQYKKLRDTYLDALLRENVNGVIHTFFDLHIPRTFRSSSSAPNLQNIPKRNEMAMYLIRKGIIPRKGHQLLEADWSGAEVRTSACYHKDPNMISYIMDKTTDMHRDMAKQLFLIKDFDKAITGHATLRQAAKNGFVFPEFYGDYYEHCAKYLACDWGQLSEGRWSDGQGMKIGDTYLSDHLIRAGIKSYAAFVTHVQKVENDFWGNRFRIYNKWKDRRWVEYQRNGYFDMLTGFRCSGVMSRNDVSNYPIQGASFHTLLWCFIELDRISREEKWDSKLIGQIHDSMIWDIHPAERDYVIETMIRVATKDLPEHWNWIIVPMELEFELCPVDASWADKEEFKLNS